MHRALPLLLLFPPASVAATTAQGSAQARPETSGEGQEIIITARRTAEPLARAPVPVSVLGGDQLRERNLFQISSLQDAFPALSVSSNSTGNLVFIRGVGNFTLQPNSDPAAATAFDGVFIARPIGTTTQYYDLARVELLKGPQGVLYGRNASAGSINLEPRRPLLGETSAYAHLGIGSADHRRLEGAANVALGKASALRLSTMVSRDDHLLQGYSEGQQERAFRGQFATRVGPADVRLVVDHAKVTGIAAANAYLGNYVFSPATGHYDFVDARLPLSSGLYSAPSQAYRQTIFLPTAGRNLDALTSRPRQDNSFLGIHAHVDADLGFGRLTLIPAWRRTRVDLVAPGAPFGLAQDDKLGQRSFEARLAGRSGPIDWLAGTFLFRDSIDSQTATNLSSSLILTEQGYRTASAALFGHLTWRAAEGIRLSGGARWTRDRKSYSSESNNLNIFCTQRLANRPSCPNVPLFPLVRSVGAVPFALPPAAGGTVPIIVGGVPTGALSNWTRRIDNGRLTDKAVTWRVGAEADLGPQTLLYSSVETGYRPGGFNAATGFETFEPERITATTLGLRHRSSDQRWSLDLEAFHWNYRDQQVSSLRPDLSSPPRNANITANIASSHIRGVEADLRFRPWRGGELSSIVHYLDADYRSFRFLQANTNVPPLTGCTATLSAATNLYGVDCSAQRPYQTPRWSILLSAAQSVKLGQWTLTGAADTHHRTARNIGFAFLPQQRIGATWRSNLRLSATSPGGRFEVGATLRNLENERVPDFVIFHPVSNAVVAGTTPPRSWGLWLLGRF